MCIAQGGFWSGVATRRREEGMWLCVGRIRADTPAGQSGIREEDLVLRYNEDVALCGSEKS
jgi:hypothetical protein